MKTNLWRRVEKLEQREPGNWISNSPQFDRDALAIYVAVAYLNAITQPDSNTLAATDVYKHGEVLRDKLHGPIIPAHLDEHFKRYTRASGEFELAFGREPKMGDILCYDHVMWLHRSEVYCRHFQFLADAWRRQLPHLACPFKFENGRLFTRIAPRNLGEDATWEEDIGVRPRARWLGTPEVAEHTELDPNTNHMVTITGLVFVGQVGAKHKCRAATSEDLKLVPLQAPIKDPSWFLLGEQRYFDLLAC